MLLFSFLVLVNMKTSLGIFGHKFYFVLVFGLVFFDYYHCALSRH